MSGIAKKKQDPFLGSLRFRMVEPPALLDFEDYATDDELIYRKLPSLKRVINSHEDLRGLLNDGLKSDTSVNPSTTKEYREKFVRLATLLQKEYPDTFLSGVKHANLLGVAKSLLDEKQRSTIYTALNEALESRVANNKPKGVEGDVALSSFGRCFVMSAYGKGSTVTDQDVTALKHMVSRLPQGSRVTVERTPILASAAFNVSADGGYDALAERCQRVTSARDNNPLTVGEVLSLAYK